MIPLPSQVTQVLEGMGLSDYKDVVEREGIDGEILAELDEATLIKEMGVASRIHRLKIMKLISGDYDARNYDSKKNTSSTFTMSESV